MTTRRLTLPDLDLNSAPVENFMREALTKVHPDYHKYFIPHEVFETRFNPVFIKEAAACWAGYCIDQVPYDVEFFDDQTSWGLISTDSGIVSATVPAANDSVFNSVQSRLEKLKPDHSEFWAEYRTYLVRVIRRLIQDLLIEWIDQRLI